MIKRIMVPLDGSKLAESALDYVEEEDIAQPAAGRPMGRRRPDIAGPDNGDLLAHRNTSLIY